MLTKSTIMRLFLLVSVMSFLFTSCQKDVNGCTNNSATNYNSSATIDNNSCEFEATVMVYQTESSAYFNVALGIAKTRYYVNGENIGEINGSTYWNSAPSCSDYTSLPSTTINLGNNTVGVFSMSTYIYRNGGWEFLAEGDITIDANECKTLAL